jgi:hypothetical protein
VGFDSSNFDSNFVAAISYSVTAKGIAKEIKKIAEKEEAIKKVAK